MTTKTKIIAAVIAVAAVGVSTYFLGGEYFQGKMSNKLTIEKPDKVQPLTQVCIDKLIFSYDPDGISEAVQSESKFTELENAILYMKDNDAVCEYKIQLGMQHGETNQMMMMQRGIVMIEDICSQEDISYELNDYFGLECKNSNSLFERSLSIGNFRPGYELTSVAELKMLTGEEAFYFSAGSLDDYYYINIYQQ